MTTKVQIESLNLVDDCVFRVGDYLYATDGFICGRAPHDGREEATGDFPPAPSLCWDRDQYRPRPDRVFQPGEQIGGECRNCCGTGRSADCQECEDGLVECPCCGSEVDCDNCGGKGVVFGAMTNQDCRQCGGTGIAPRSDAYVTIGEHHLLSEHAASVLARLGASVYLPVQPQQPAYWTGGDIDGLVGLKRLESRP